MNKKFKQFLAILATGVLSVGTAGMLSACGGSKGKDDDQKEPETPVEQQPVTPEPEVVNEINEFRAVAKTVVTVTNNFFNPVSSAALGVNLQPQNAFRIYPMAVEPDLNQTLLDYLGEASANAAESADGIYKAQGAVFNISLADACAYLMAQRGKTKLYGEILYLPQYHQYFRVTKSGNVWVVEEFQTNEANQPTNAYRFEIERKNETSFKMRYYFHMYNADGTVRNDLAYNYIDSDGNYVSCEGTGEDTVYYYGQKTSNGFKTWAITDTTVQANCQGAITENLGSVQPVNLSKESGAESNKFSEKEIEEAEAAISGNQGSGSETETPETPKHEAVTAWSKDETHHWHACSVEGCNDATHVNKVAHVYNPTTHLCECGAEDPSVGSGETEHVAASTWQTNEESHWHGCATDANDDHTYNLGAHTWTVNGAIYTCSVCGYEKTETVTDVNDLHVQTLQTAWQNLANYQGALTFNMNGMMDVSIEPSEGIFYASGYEGGCKVVKNGDSYVSCTLTVDKNGKTNYVYGLVDDQYAANYMAYVIKSGMLDHKLERVYMFDIKSLFDVEDESRLDNATFAEHFLAFAMENLGINDAQLDKSESSTTYDMENGVLMVTSSAQTIKQDNQYRVLTMVFKVNNGVFESLSIEMNMIKETEIDGETQTQTQTVMSISQAYAFDRDGYNKVAVGEIPDDVKTLICPISIEYQVSYLDGSNKEDRDGTISMESITFPYKSQVTINDINAYIAQIKDRFVEHFALYDASQVTIEWTNEDFKTSFNSTTVNLPNVILYAKITVGDVVLTGKTYTCNRVEWSGEASDAQKAPYAVYENMTFTFIDGSNVILSNPTNNSMNCTYTIADNRYLTIQDGDNVVGRYEIKSGGVLSMMDLPPVAEHVYPTVIFECQ